MSAALKYSDALQDKERAGLYKLVPLMKIFAFIAIAGVF
jgi:hypothetical protein